MPEEQTVLTVQTPEPEAQEVELSEEASPEETEDPGQREGRRESQDHVPPVRFEQVYAKWKGAEKKIGELSTKITSNDAVLEEIRKHNSQLMGKLEQLSNKAIDAVGQKIDLPPGQEPPEIKTARSAISDLEDKKADAIEKLEAKEVIRIDRELRKLERIVDGYENQVEIKRRTPSKTTASVPEIPPEISQFQVDTKEWFNKDPMMTGAAKEFDFYLSNQPEWQSRPLKERLAEVKKVIESRFGNGGRESQPKNKPAGAESGLGLSRPSTGPRTVKLTSQEMAVAQGLGLTPEEYAKQKTFIGGTF